VDPKVAEKLTHPDAEAGLAVELLESASRSSGTHLERVARVGLVDEAPEGVTAEREDLRIRRLDARLRHRVDLAVCRGAHQFGVRWNTVRWPTVLAISVIAWTAVAPVPITATACPEAHGSCGHCRCG